MATIKEMFKERLENERLNHNLGLNERNWYEAGATDQRKIDMNLFLDAYCLTCCNLDRKACIELDGMCKQYQKLVTTIKEKENQTTKEI